MAKIIHDRIRCQSIGVCESLAADNFEFNEANEMVVIGDGTVGDDQLDQVREAVAGCPDEALALLDDDGGGNQAGSSSAPRGRLFFFDTGYDPSAISHTNCRRRSPRV